MKFRLLSLLICVWLLTNCSTSPTPVPVPEPTSSPSPTSTPAPTDVALNPPTATENAYGLNIVAGFDATARVLTIYGITPAATVMIGGTPLLPPPTAIATDTPEPTSTPPPSATRPPPVVIPRPTAVPTTLITQASLRGKIVFKSSRDGGFFPNRFSYYSMNADGTGVVMLDFKTMDPLYVQMQSREGYSPDGSQIVLGERRCFFGTCALYILDTTLDAALINSNNDISHGQWITYKGFQAKDPVWSPTGNYVVFASNHEQPSGQGCVRTVNIFKGAPTQKPTIRRLTQFCAGSNGGHPSFSPDGSEATFWSEDSGLHQIYVLSVGADDGFDFRLANPHIITDHQSDDWDPLWVK
jgi:WD40-like Beta Propeller Repeat